MTKVTNKAVANAYGKNACEKNVLLLIEDIFLSSKQSVAIT